MNKCGIILVIFAVLSVALSIVRFTTTIIPNQNFSDADHPGKCFIRANLILIPGKHTDPNDPCKEYNCEKDGSGSIEITSPAGCDTEYIKQQLQRNGYLKF